MTRLIDTLHGISSATDHAYGVDHYEISLEEQQQFSEAIKKDALDYLMLEGSVAARNHIGGTAPERVWEAAKKAKDVLNG